MQGLLQLPTNCIHKRLLIKLWYLRVCARVCVRENVWYLRMYVCMCLRQQHLALGVGNLGPQGADEEQRWCFTGGKDWSDSSIEWKMCDLTYQRNSERGRSPRYPWRRTCNGELKRMPVGVCTALPPAGYHPRVLDICLVRLSWNVLHMWPTLHCGNIIPMVLFCSNNTKLCLKPGLHIRFPWLLRRSNLTYLYGIQPVGNIWWYNKIILYTSWEWMCS